MTSAARKQSAQALADRLAEDLAMLRATPGIPPALLTHKASEIELMIDALRALAAAQGTDDEIDRVACAIADAIARANNDISVEDLARAAVLAMNPHASPSAPPATWCVARGSRKGNKHGQ